MQLSINVRTSRRKTRKVKRAHPYCHPHKRLYWTMAGTHLLKSFGDLPYDLGKPRERSLKALDPKDPNDRAFWLVSCTGLFLFIFVYSRLSTAPPVRTSASLRAGSRRPRRRRVTTALQQRQHRDGIIAAYQRPQRPRILTQQEAVAMVAGLRTGGNNNEESPCCSKDDSYGSIVTC